MNSDAVQSMGRLEAILTNVPAAKSHRGGYEEASQRLLPQTYGLCRLTLLIEQRRELTNGYSQQDGILKMLKNIGIWKVKWKTTCNNIEEEIEGFLP